MTEIRGPRVEEDCGELWLTWEEAVAGGVFWRWDQRRLTRFEGLLWRMFRRVPRICPDGGAEQ